MEDLPPGFRFYPTEEELVSFYLHNKLEGRREDLNRVIDRIIPVLDIYEHNPWDLPQFAGDLSSRDPEQWFFFIARQESEARGGRPKRLTTNGYWKATGSPGNVYSNNNKIIGMKRTMVFYIGRAPQGRKTDWKMNEYKSALPYSFSSSSSSSSTTVAPPTMELRQKFSLCRVYKASKSLRAFDRRPTRVEMPFHGDEATQSHPNNPSSSEEIRPNSPETSSADPTIPSQSGDEITTMPMSIDSDLLWGWDQLDFYYGQDHQN